MRDNRTCSVGLKFELEEVDSWCNTRGVIKHKRDKRKIISSLISLARLVFRKTITGVRVGLSVVLCILIIIIMI